MKKIDKDHFRVAIFGSARIKKGDKWYKLVYNLARHIGSDGIDVVTGGGPGLMDAASRGHYAGKKKSNNHSHSVGLTIELPKGQMESFHLDIKKDFHRFSKRLDTFMELSNVVVVAPGGIGTLLEFLYTWQLVQAHHICEIPIILLGDRWKGLVRWVRKEMLAKKLMNNEDFDFIFVVSTPTQAIKLIRKFKKESGKGHVCKSYRRYI